MVDPNPLRGMPKQLQVYWIAGPGGQKIMWRTKGSMRRCITLMTEYFPKEPGGMCAILHKKATGEWPTEHGKAGIPS